MHSSHRINTAGLLTRVGGASERSFREIELLKEFEEEENNAPDDVVDDDNYLSSDLFFEEVDGKDYDLCSGCDGNLFSTLSNRAGI